MAGFADLFGGMFGGGGPAPTPGLLDAAGYMDPAQYDAARRSQGMMGLWAGLLQGGGPSLEPRNFGSALGAGLVGQQKFGSTFDEDQLHSSQAAQARANVGKLGAETEAQRAAIKLLGQADQIPVGMQAPGAAGAGGTGAVPNFGGGTGGGGGGWGSHANTAIETLKAAGYSDAAIAGIMANGLGEGGFKNNWQKAWGDENSFGHWQFYEKGELPGYRAFVKEQGGDERDTRLQALYVAKRAEEVSPGFSKLTDPKLATDIFATKFEKYKGAAYGQRYGLLADAQRYMAGTPVEERQPIPAGPGGYTGTPETARGAPAPGGAIPPVPSYAGAFGGPGAPVPAAVAGGPAAPAPAAAVPPDAVRRVPLRPDYTGASGRPAIPPWIQTNSRGEPISPDLTATLPGQQSGANIPAGMRFPRLEPPGGGSGSSMPAPDAGYGGGGDDMPASPYGSGVFSPAAQAIAAAAAQAPPVPATAVAPAPPVPAAPPTAAAPAPAVLAPGTPQTPMQALIPALQALQAAQGTGEAALPAPPAPVRATPPPMPGAVAPPPLPAAQAPPSAGAQPYNPQAHRAQMIANAMALMGRSVPAHIAEAAGLPLAGQKAAQEAAAKQPYALQAAQQQQAAAAQLKQWEALNENEQRAVAAQNDLTKEQFKKQLDIAAAGPVAIAQLGPKLMELAFKSEAEWQAEWYKPKDYKQVDPTTGRERTISLAPADLYGGVSPQAAQRAAQQAAGGAPGGAPQGPAPAPGVVTGLGPLATKEFEGRGTELADLSKKITNQASTAGNDLAKLRIMQDASANLAQQGILSNSTQFANRVINALTGQQAERVAAFERVTKNSESFIRDITRESDSQPAAIQLVMTRNSMPTPNTSKSGFDAVLGQMVGASEYLQYKAKERDRWLNNPANNNSLQGFEGSLPVSPYAFMIHRMPQNEQAALKAKLQAAGPQGIKEMTILADQLDAIRAAGF